MKQWYVLMIYYVFLIEKNVNGVLYIITSNPIWYIAYCTEVWNSIIRDFFFQNIWMHTQKRKISLVTDQHKIITSYKGWQLQFSIGLENSLN